MRRAIAAALLLLGCGGADPALTDPAASGGLTAGQACELYACPCAGGTHVIPTCNGLLSAPKECPALDVNLCRYVGPQYPPNVTPSPAPPCTVGPCPG